MRSGRLPYPIPMTANRSDGHWWSRRGINYGNWCLCSSQRKFSSLYAFWWNIWIMKQYDCIHIFIRWMGIRPWIGWLIPYDAGSTIFRWHVYDIRSNRYYIIAFGTSTHVTSWWWWQVLSAIVATSQGGLISKNSLTEELLALLPKLHFMTLDPCLVTDIWPSGWRIILLSVYGAARYEDSGMVTR